jgi:hypothetical protein
MLKWLEETSLGLWVGQSDWGYPLVLATHAVGMAILAGVIIMINLRVLGVAPGAPVARFKRMLDLIYFGLVINVASGIALFFGGATRIGVSWAFWAKLACIAVGLWAFFRVFNSFTPDAGEPGRSQKNLAILSIILWVLAIVFGRLIAYLD